jgi:hypothetical protein
MFQVVRTTQNAHVRKEVRLGIWHSHPPNTTLAFTFGKVFFKIV